VVEDFAEAGTDPREFRLMDRREIFEHPPAARREPNQDLAMAPWVAGLGNQAIGLHAIDEADRAVVADFEPLGEIADGQALSFRTPANYEHGLVLLRRYAGVEGSLFAKVQEFPERMAERGQMPVIGLRDVGESWFFWSEFRHGLEDNIS
jgi:hypothetical protein